MGKTCFVIAGDRATIVANDVNDFRYRAAVHYLAVGEQVPVRCHDNAETQFMIEDGMVEFMIGGAAGIVMAGDFVRVPPGVCYAYRNFGDEPAQILVRTTSPHVARRALWIGFDFAA